MVRVHAAGSIAEAELVRETLASAGHHVHLRGLSRPGLAGEIPIPDAVVGVWVPDDEGPAARAVLAAVEARAHLDWLCPHCGERNPASFERCWNCESPLA